MLLTIAESFFRDSGQLSLLKNKLLPELLANKRKNCEGKNKKPSLKI
jgi:chemotaxis methyl-accepting protein methylase